MKTEDILKFALLAGVGYLIYRLFNVASSAAGSAYKAAQQATDGIAQTMADAWLMISPLPPAMNLVGNIALPDGTLIPISDADIREGKNNIVIASYQGQFYQLSPSDDAGNWPATLLI